MAGGAVCVPTPGREASLPLPSCLCVHTAPTCVWGGDRRPQRGGDALGPRSLEIGSVNPLVVRVGLIVLCRARARPGYLERGSCGFWVWEDPGVAYTRSSRGCPRWQCVGKSAVPPSVSSTPSDSEDWLPTPRSWGLVFWAPRSRGRVRVAPLSRNARVDPCTQALCGCACPRPPLLSQALEEISALCVPLPVRPGSSAGQRLTGGPGSSSGQCCCPCGCRVSGWPHTFAGSASLALELRGRGLSSGLVARALREEATGAPDSAAAGGSGRRK